MGSWNIENVEQFVERRGTHDELVIVLHRWSGTPAKMQGVVAAIAAARPNADVFVPELPFAGFWGRFSMKRAEDVASALVDAIDILVDKRARDGSAYSSILLVGHSFGSVLARKIAILANGETLDVPFEDGLERFRDARRWAGAIKRIVLLAGMSGGWALSSAMSWTRTLVWGWNTFIGDVFWCGGWTIFALRKGAPFLVQTRLQWLALMRRSEPPRIVVVQLLGTVDDMVAPDDNIDYAVDFSGTFQLIEVRQTGHHDVINMTAPNGPQDQTPSAHRWEIFCIALNNEGAVHGLPTKLEDLAIPREHMADSLPPEPNDEVTDVVFVIHGIRDEGFWTQKVARAIKKRAAGRHEDFRSVTTSYGYFAMAPFVLPWIRRRKVAWLMDQYAEARAHYPRAKFSYVGHSNGTYLVARALRDYPAARFKRIVLAGSVVRCDYDWKSLILPAELGSRIRERVERVLNYVATNDRVVAIFPNGLEPIPLFDLGGAGHNGFLQGSAAGPVYQVKFIKGGHGAGHEERHWDEIAGFIVDETIPDGDAAAQNRVAVCLATISTPFVIVLLIILLGIGAILVTSVVSIFTGVPWKTGPFSTPPTAGIAAIRSLCTMFYFWLVYFVLSRI
jgi:pimeloyl-ACP methyl ester carboxylesterase